MMEETTKNIVVILVFAMLLAALVLTAWRLMKGPSVNDRIMAMEVIAIIVMGFVIAYSILINNAIYIDIPVIISLISFIGTVAVSTYLKHRYE